jgi:hypothetical protein
MKFECFPRNLSRSRMKFSSLAVVFAMTLSVVVGESAAYSEDRAIRIAVHRPRRSMTAGYVRLSG